MAKGKLIRKYRGSKLDDDLAKRITDLIGAGNYPETAAAACGIPRTTMLMWLKLGADKREAIEGGALTPDDVTNHEAKCITFTLAVDEALGKAEARDVVTIARAAQGTDKAPGDWRAAAFFLERRNPERWAKKEEVKHSGELKTNTWLDVVMLSQKPRTP